MSYKFRLHLIYPFSIIYLQTSDSMLFKAFNLQMCVLFRMFQGLDHARMGLLINRFAWPCVNIMLLCSSVHMTPLCQQSVSPSCHCVLKNRAINGSYQPGQNALFICTHIWVKCAALYALARIHTHFPSAEKWPLYSSSQPCIF